MSKIELTVKVDKIELIEKMENYLESIIEHYDEQEDLNDSNKDYYRGKKEAYEDILYRISGER